MTLPFSNARTGGKILVDQLLIHGADMAFCVPGESYLEVLDALFDVRDRFKLVNARHEAGAANMAEAYGKLTGRPGICMVTRGPGACHAAVGVHTAFQDSTPMIMLIGQVGRDMMDREAFQEIDYRQMFGPVAKWAAQIDVTARIPEYIARAFHIATSGRPGPVVLALPEDMLTEVTQSGDAVCYHATQPAPAAAVFPQIRELLEGAKKPMILVGGPGWSDRACAQLRGFAEANGIPVATSFRRQDILDNRSSCFAGDLGTSGPPALVQRFKEADLLLVIGARLGEMTTQGYSILSAPRARPKLIHVHADANELGKVFTPDIAVLSSSDNFMAELADVGWFAADRWSGWRNSARTDYLNAVAPARLHPGAGCRRRDDRARQAARRRRHRHARRRQSHRLAAALSDLRPAGPPDRAHQRRDGLFGAGGRCRVAGASGPRGDRLRRRWRFHDERTGNLDRRAARRQADHSAVQQQHVRHHPHASGA